MIERESVIRAIEHCNIPGNGGCTGCPYQGQSLCRAQLGLAAIKLLKQDAPELEKPEKAGDTL